MKYCLYIFSFKSHHSSMLLVLVSFSSPQWGSMHCNLPKITNLIVEPRCKSRQSFLLICTISTDQENVQLLKYSSLRCSFRSIISPYYSYFKSLIFRIKTSKQDKIQPFITSFWHLLLTSLVMIIWHTRYLCGAHIRNQWISQHVFIEFIYVHGRLLSEEEGCGGR